MVDYHTLAEVFDINNKKVDLSPVQLEIFKSIVSRKSHRVICILPTQYGKSFTVALAVITRAMIFAGEKWIIVAPSEKKARVIMNYVINHIFDFSVYAAKLDTDNKERLKKEQSKKRITLLNGSSIEILTLDARNSKKKNEAAMGHGAPNIILDESSLVDDVLYASVKRMLGGHKDNFLFEIGNPFYRNHFYRTFTHDENYEKIFADYKTALGEGRFTESFIDEMRKEAMFDVYYECKFPDESTINADGYRSMFPSSIVEIKNGTHQGKKRLGVDVGGGGDKTVFVLRSDTYSEVIDAYKTPDIMSIVGRVFELSNEHGVYANEIYIDDTGIGRGVSDRLKEQGHNINQVVVGKKASTKRYANIKAEITHKCMQWIKEGGVLGSSQFSKLTEIFYKVQSDKRIQIEPKDRLRARIGHSPDELDALFLTFAAPRQIQTWASKPQGF